MSDRTDRGNRPEREEGADRARRGEGDRRRQGRPPHKRNGHDGRGGRDERGGKDRGRGGKGGRSHKQRAGAGRGKRFNPQRSGFREERLNHRANDPDLPGDIDIKDLDPMVLQDLKVLSKENSDAVAKHLIMAATWMADDPHLALHHARAAKDRAGRVAVARETNGIAAYHAGEWKEALAELRAARRISGGPGLLAVMADCERGLGRPEKAIDLQRSPEARDLDAASKVELAIVAAGARLDLGEAPAAVVTLERAHPSKDARGETACRLGYAYANALAAAGRAAEAKDWFAHVARIDDNEWTDAADRLREL